MGWPCYPSIVHQKETLLNLPDNTELFMLHSWTRAQYQSGFLYNLTCSYGNMYNITWITLITHYWRSIRKYIGRKRRQSSSHCGPRPRSLLLPSYYICVSIVIRNFVISRASTQRKLFKDDFFTLANLILTVCNLLQQNTIRRPTYTDIKL